MSGAWGPAGLDEPYCSPLDDLIPGSGTTTFKISKKSSFKIFQHLNSIKLTIFLYYLVLRYFLSSYLSFVSVGDDISR